MKKKGDEARNVKFILIGKDFHSVTTQKIEGLTDGGEIVKYLESDKEIFNLDRFECFVITYEFPMWDCYCEPGDPPTEWEEETIATKTIDDMIRIVSNNLNVEEIDDEQA